MQLSAVDKPPTYRLTFRRRLVNALIGALVRLGAGPNSTYLLTTRGRRSGKFRSTPVTLVEAEGRRWLVAPLRARPTQSGRKGTSAAARAFGDGRGGRSLTARLASVTPTGPPRPTVLSTEKRRGS